MLPAKLLLFHALVIFISPFLASWTLQNATGLNQQSQIQQLPHAPSSKLQPPSLQRFRVAPTVYRPQEQSAFGAIGNLATAPLGVHFCPS